MRAIAILVLALAQSVWAQPSATPQACAASFPVRLRDARDAIVDQSTYMREYEAVMPWFNQHCRLLSEAERVRRRIDDEMAFVCDTQRGRPRELTGEFIATHSVPADIPSFQEHAAENDRCREHDARERVSLVLRDAGPFEKGEVMCFQETTAACDALREQMAAARARQAARQQESQPRPSP